MTRDPFSLAGKRILVTGASSGIGRACAIEMSHRGAEVLAVARREAELSETLSMLTGSNHRSFVFDLERVDTINSWMNEVASQTGAIDGIIHCAGIFKTMPLRGVSAEAFRSIMQINVEAGFFLAKAFRQKNVRAASGSIVFMGSVMSLVGQPGLSAYCTSKGALVSLTKSLAIELAPEKIRVNLIAPGQVETPMMHQSTGTVPEASVEAIRKSHPLGIGQAEDVACACVYLMADAAKWVTGTTLVVDGGYTAA